MTQLDCLQEIVDLEIKGLESLSKCRRKYFECVEEKVKNKYNVPSLSAYLLYEHQFNGKTLNELANELECNINRLYGLIKSLNIPARNRAEAGQVKRKMFLGKVRSRLKEVANKENIPVRDYLAREYKLKGVSKLARDLGASRQILYNILEDLNISLNPSPPSIGDLEKKCRKTYKISFKGYFEREHYERNRPVKEIAKELGVHHTTLYRLTKKLGLTTRGIISLKGRKSPMSGKTLEEIYGKERASEIKRKIAQSKSGKNHPMFGKHLPEEWRHNISLGHKRSV